MIHAHLFAVWRKSSCPFKSDMDRIIEMLSLNVLATYQQLTDWASRTAHISTVCRRLTPCAFTARPYHKDAASPLGCRDSFHPEHGGSWSLRHAAFKTPKLKSAADTPTEGQVRSSDVFAAVQLIVPVTGYYNRDGMKELTSFLVDRRLLKDEGNWFLRNVGVRVPSDAGHACTRTEILWFAI